ncbi:hypothetical protein GCM10010401_06500 [Rarobacter faecitabidus]|uniref:Uncharacterized protein n=1 Tax=Rarobacter faecitabidus TaxID=13243 RepID=A0A542ZTK5_RARFA|nr:hypothetical protein [Rarobacter faecitabidus]TQL63599.1 hypothetical protein FB461_0065 [Rarobacter faecitabidus]
MPHATQPQAGVGGTVSRHLRHRRAVLRAELAATGHWRRLIRAKIDLTVARGAGPGPLTAESGGARHLNALNTDLRTLMTIPASGFALTDLPALRDLDKRLASHESAVRRELMDVTDRLVEHLADDGLAKQPM